MPCGKGTNHRVPQKETEQQIYTEPQKKRPTKNIQFSFILTFIQ